MVISCEYVLFSNNVLFSDVFSIRYASKAAHQRKHSSSTIPPEHQVCVWLCDYLMCVVCDANRICIHKRVCVCVSVCTPRFTNNAHQNIIIGPFYLPGTTQMQYIVNTIYNPARCGTPFFHIGDEMRKQKGCGAFWNIDGLIFGRCTEKKHQ